MEAVASAVGHAVTTLIALNFQWESVTHRTLCGGDLGERSNQAGAQGRPGKQTAQRVRTGRKEEMRARAAGRKADV